MLEITIKKGHTERYDYKNEQFVDTNIKEDIHLKLEHSLVSISKWESKWHKPFLNKDKKTDEELLDYIRCMIVIPEVSSDVLYALTNEDYQKINAYLEDPMSATTFHTHKESDKARSSIGLEYTAPKGEIPTAEIIYYQMIEYGIPDRYEKWHLNRLLTLIHVCQIKERNKAKAEQKQMGMQNHGLNKARHGVHR